MRSRTCETIRHHAGRGRAVTTKNGSPVALLLALVASTMLAGCIVEIPTPSLNISNGIDKQPIDETGSWTYRDPTEKELLLARSDFSVEVVRFTDSRRPRSMQLETRDQMIYQYDPDSLMGGVSTNVPAILGKYLSYRPKMPKHYKVEMDVRKLVTNIKTGTFWSGHWGRYHVAFEVSVIARRPDSTVALQKTYRYDEMQPRQDYDGRGPSKERDRARMVDLTESILRKTAEQIGWELRMRDARAWKAPAPQSIPTRLNLPPVDRAAGNADVDTAPARLMPVERTVAPVVVPSAPADSMQDGLMPRDEGIRIENDVVVPGSVI